MKAIVSLNDFLSGHKPKEKPSAKRPAAQLVKKVADIEYEEEHDIHFVSNFFGVHEQTIYRWIRENIIECNYDIGSDGRRVNIRFTAQQIADRKTRRKHG